MPTALDFIRMSKNKKQRRVREKRVPLRERLIARAQARSLQRAAIDDLVAKYDETNRTLEPQTAGS